MTKDLKNALEKYFGYETFKEGQEEIITAVRNGSDCVGVLPTGAGKSLCYQLPALVRGGLTLVVSPLIALMKDQVDALEERGIPATFINSSLEWSELSARLDGLRQGRYRLVYVAPERFRNEAFRAALRGVRLDLLAVDEAHCISMWGHDFRPDYQRLRIVLDELEHPQVIALTATATPVVRDDIIAQLGLGEGTRRPPEVVVSGFARRNLTLAVERVQGQDDKLRRTRAILGERETGIVYCATRKNVDRVERLLREGGLDCVAYHAGMGEDERRRRQELFVRGEKPVAVATNAFGMGIDRADLRAIIHWDLPGSIEAYYQEAGRAGRDGEPALCSLLFNYADVRTQEFFIEGANPPVRLVERVARAVGELAKNGPLERAAMRVADFIGGRPNKMAVNTALGLLERAGMVLKTVDGETGAEGLKLLDPDADLSGILQGLERKSRRDREKLRRMLDYVQARSDCRHRFILDYFGDRQPFDDCRQCDSCLRRGGVEDANRREPTDEEWPEVQKALSAVARLDTRFGFARITGVLAGSRDKEIFRLGLEELPTYGALEDRNRRFIRQLLEDLVDAGCLVVSRGEYPTLGITERGRRVMRRDESVRLSFPVPRTAAESRAAGDSASPRSSDTVLQQGDPLTEKLVTWRRELAQSESVPAFHIFTNATLGEIARARPVTMDELGEVRGIGPAKLDRFGEAVLTLVNE